MSVAFPPSRLPAFPPSRLLNWDFRLFPLMVLTMALAACGGGGGGGETNQTNVSGGSQTISSTLTGPNIPPSQQTSVAYDTAISSSGHIQTSQGSDTIGVNCNGLKCRTSTGVSLDSSISLALKRYEKLQRNGRVNGPYEESGTATTNGATANVTVYGFWMGDSIYGVASENGYVNGNYYTGQNATLLGDNTGSRPRGNAAYTGKTVAIYVNDDYDDYDIGDVEYGDFEATYDFGDSTIEIDLDFDNWGVTLNPTTVNSNGSFSRATNDGGNLKGNFFGSNHNEVAGTYDLPSESVVGSFGGIKEINSTPSVTPEPEIVVNRPLANFRDTSIASIPHYQELFRENPSLISFFENQTTILPPGVDDEGYGMFQANGFSPLWYGNPNVDLPMDGQFGLIVDRPPIGGRGWVKLNQNDYNNYFLKVRNDLYDFGLTDESSRAMTMFFMTEINRAVQLGYAEWMRHLNYDPGELSLRIFPGRGEGWIGAYSHATDEVIISSDWLDEQVIDWINHIRYGEGRNPVFDSLVNLVTHEAAHQFGYENPNGDSEGCGSGRKCHGPVGSGSVTSYDIHKGLSVNYHVTAEDVKHIPNATYNEDESQLYGVLRSTDIGQYGVWINHYFYIEGTTNPGSDRGGLSHVDSIGANPSFIPRPGFEPEIIPTGSATYSGEDNLIGVDMSDHYLGALLQADANLIYNFSASPTIDLTVDNFEVYDGNKWNQQNGSITYNLECIQNACGTENGNNLIGVGFTNNGEHSYGRIRDFDNDYVGAFVAEKD